MKFKYNDIVEINHDFYGKCKAIIKRFEHDYEACGMNPNNGKCIHNDNCQTYCINLILKDEVIELPNVLEKDLKFLFSEVGE